MKRVISILLVVVLLMFSVISTGALSFLWPNEYVDIPLKFKYYEAVNSRTERPTVTKADVILELGDYNDIEAPMYICVQFTTPDAIQEPYFNRFGENDEYYEYSEITNTLYGSGITVYYGLAWYPYQGTNEAFYSLDEMAQMEPRVIDWVLDYLGPDYVGKIGDADKDGVLTILDATAIQRHLVEIEPMNIELVGDVDGDGETNILDATVLQQRLVGLK